MEDEPEESSAEVPSPQDAGKGTDESVPWYKFDNLLMTKGCNMVSPSLWLHTAHVTLQNAHPHHTYYSLHS